MTPAAREALYLELVKLKRQHVIPVIIVTRDLNEAMLLAERVILLTHGSALQGNAGVAARNPALSRPFGVYRFAFALRLSGWGLEIVRSL